MSNQAFLDGYLSKEAGPEVPATLEEVARESKDWRKLWTDIASRARPALSSTPDKFGKYPFPGTKGSAPMKPAPVPWEMLAEPRIAALRQAKETQEQAEYAAKARAVRAAAKERYKPVPAALPKEEETP